MLGMHKVFGPCPVMTKQTNEYRIIHIELNFFFEGSLSKCTNIQRKIPVFLNYSTNINMHRTEVKGKDFDRFCKAGLQTRRSCVTKCTATSNKQGECSQNVRSFSFNLSSDSLEDYYLLQFHNKELQVQKRCVPSVAQPEAEVGSLI